MLHNIRLHIKQIIIGAAGILAAVILFFLIYTVLQMVFNGKKELTAFVPKSAVSDTAAEEEKITPLSEKKFKSTVYSRDFEDKNDIKFSVGSLVAFDGGSAWDLNAVDREQDNLYFGDDEWTDYRTGIDLLFTDNCKKDAENQFRLLTRAHTSKLYGDFYYAVTLEKGDTLKLYRAYASKVRVPGNSTVAEVKLNYLDGKKHNLKVDALDNQIVVLWDDKSVIEYLDNTGSAVLIGGIGLSAKQTDVILDNISVTKIQDPKGEDLDNKQAGNYNG